MGRLPSAVSTPLIAGLLICYSVTGAAQSVTDSEVDQKESELKQVDNQIDSLQAELGTVQQQRDKLQQELKRTEQHIGDVARRLRVLNGSLQRQKKRLGELANDRVQQQANLFEHQQALGEQVRAAYAMGRQERLKILLNQQDPALVSRMMVYYDYFNRARTARMDAINQILSGLQKTEQEIASEEERLLAMQQKERREQIQLERSRTARQEVVAALNLDINDKGTKLRGLERDKQQLQGLIKKLQKALVEIPLEADNLKPFKNKRGVLPWPTKGRLAAKFGTRKAGNLKWDGVLISAPEGREVRAIDHGRVAFADWLRGFGLMVIIDHGDGYMTLYGHNQSLFKETGEWVEAGEAVALVGSSGGQSNTGVYFGIRYKGKPVNPRKWCRAGNRNRVGQVESLPNTPDGLPLKQEKQV